MTAKAPFHWRHMTPRLKEQALLAAGWDAAPFLRDIVMVEPQAAAPIERALAMLTDARTDIPSEFRAGFRLIDGGTP